MVKGLTQKLFKAEICEMLCALIDCLLTMLAFAFFSYRDQGQWNHGGYEGYGPPKVLIRRAKPPIFSWMLDMITR